MISPRRPSPHTSTLQLRCGNRRRWWRFGEGRGTEIESCRLPPLLIFFIGWDGRRSIFDGSFVRQGSLAEKKSSKEGVLSPKLPQKGKKCALEQCGKKFENQTQKDSEGRGKRKKLF